MDPAINSNLIQLVISIYFSTDGTIREYEK
jgi:hypothetical protein